MKKLLCFLLSLVLTLSVLTACASEHTHTFDTKWMNDEEYHWHQATCEHTDEVSEKAAHEDANGDDICDVCGYIANHTHTYETTWSWNESTHYHKNSCGHADEEKYRSDIADHVDADNDSACDVCGYSYGHTHTYSLDWTPAINRADGHWHAPTCGHDVDGTDLSEHVDADNNSVCDVCAWDYEHEHTYADEFSTDENEHWKEVTCGHDIPAGEKNIHVDANKDGLCDVCGYAASHFHSAADKWTADENQHWHEITCHPDLSLKADADNHVGYEEDGICDICEYVVFKLYTVQVESTEEVAIVNESNELLQAPFIVKDGEELVFYIRMNNNQRLEEIKGGVWDPTPSDPIEVTEGIETVIYYLYKVTVTPTEDTTVSLTINNLKTFELIVNGASVTFQGNKVGSLFKDITFDAPEAGKYVIMALNDDHGELRFSNASGTVEYQSSYMFQVSKAGKVTLKARYFLWEANTSHTLKYYILRLEDDITLPHVQGTGYTLPTNTDVVVTFTMPSAGLYHITSSNAVNSNTFTWNGTVGNLLINASYAGEVVKLTISNNITNSVSFDFDWEIIKLESEGTLALNKDNKVDIDIGYYHTYTFTATKTGSYSFATGSNLTSLCRYYNLWASTTSPVSCTANTTYTFQSYYSQNYEFIAPEGTQISINGGSWKTGHVIKYIEKDTVVEYKVRYTGTAKTDPIRVIICAYNPQMSNLQNGTVSLSAGETIYVYTIDNQSVQNPAVEPFTDTVTIKYLGYNADTDSKGNPYLVPGVEWVYTAVSTGDYTFTPSSGTQISADSGKTWHSSISKTLKAGGTVSLMIKNTDGSGATAKVTITKAVYEHTVTVGENSYTFTPGKTYSIYLSGSKSPESTLPYTLSWTDSNIVVTYNGSTITSGKEINYNPTSDAITVKYNGTAQADVKLTLTDRYVQESFEAELSIGENKITMKPDKDYTFVLTGGSGVMGDYDMVPTYNYKLSWTDANIKLFMMNEDEEWVQISSGHTFYDYQNTHFYTTPIRVVYGGSSAAEISFTLEENNPVNLGELVQGSNSLALEPGKSYKFSLPANLWTDYLHHYVLTWSNANVFIEMDAVVAVSGKAFSTGYYEGSLTYTGTSATTLSLTVGLPQETVTSTDITGTGSFTLAVEDGSNGTAFTFLVTESGSYQLTDGNGAQTIYMMGCSVDEYLTGELPATLENLTAGQVVTLMIGTYSEDAGNVILVVTKL